MFSINRNNCTENIVWTDTLCFYATTFVTVLLYNMGYQESMSFFHQTRESFTHRLIYNLNLFNIDIPSARRTRLKTHQQRSRQILILLGYIRILDG